MLFFFSISCCYDLYYDSENMYQKMAVRILLAVSILMVSSYNSLSQSKSSNIDRIRISYSSPAMLTQTYEINLRKKIVYFINPSLSYLHVKGGKYKRRVNYRRSKRREIFRLVDQVAWLKLRQAESPAADTTIYVIETFCADNTIGSYSFSEGLMPVDLKALYAAISKRQIRPN